MEAWGAESAAAASEVGEAVRGFMAPEGPIDALALAGYWGLAHDCDGPGASKDAQEEAKEMESQRKALRLALFAKAEAEALALAEAGGGSVLPAKPPASDEPPSPLAEAVREMQQWVTKPQDLPEEERDGLAITLARYHCSLGRPGEALATLHARLKEQPASSGEKAKRVAKETGDLYQALGWGHWSRNLHEALAEKYPSVKVPL